MARLTVEDCEEFVSNRFDLVIMASTRSREILSGAPISVERDGDKTSVISLREIAAQSISVDSMREMTIRNFQSSRNRIDFDQSESEAENDSFSAAGDDIVNPEFAALENQSLESGFDQVTEILDEDLDVGLALDEQR